MQRTAVRLVTRRWLGEAALASLALAACGGGATVSQSGTVGSATAATTSRAGTTASGGGTRVVATSASASVTATASASVTGTAPSGTLTLYTSEPQDLVAQMTADFQKVVPGVKVNIFRDGTEPLIAKIKAEQQAGGIQADLLWFANYSFLKGLADAGQLLPYTPPTAAALPGAYNYLSGAMHEIRLIFNIIGVNTSAVKTKPTGWKSLADPAYKGKIGLASPSYSGAALLTLGVLVQQPDFGWPYFQHLKDNGAVVEQSNGAVGNKLVSGEYGVVSVVDFQVRAAANKGAPVEQVWPSEGAVLIPTPIAILKSSKQQAAAQALIEYALSDRGQKLLVGQNYIPVLPGIDGPKGAPAVTAIKTLPSAEDYVAQNGEALKKHFDQIFVGGS